MEAHTRAKAVLLNLIIVKRVIGVLHLVLAAVSTNLSSNGNHPIHGLVTIQSIILRMTRTIAGSG